MRGISTIGSVSEHFKEVCFQCKKSLRWAFGISFLVNILMLTQPIYMLQVFGRVLPSYSKETLFYLTLMVVIALGALALLFWVRGRMLSHIGDWFSETLSAICVRDTPDQILAGDQYGAQSQRDIASVSQFIGGTAMVALLDAPWVPLYIAVSFVLHTYLGIITLIGAVFLFSMGVVNEMLTRNPSKEASARALINQRFLESAMYNAEVIQAMGMMGNIVNSWNTSRSKIASDNLSVQRTSNAIQSFTRFCRLSLQIFILGVGAYLVLEGSLASGGMIAGSILMGRALAPLENSIAAWKQFVQARQAFVRLEQHLGKPNLRQNATHPQTPKGEVTVTEAYYTLPNRAEPILANLNFEVSPGSVVGIIGPSGAGKTSLARLLTGVLAPVRGSVRMDGAEIFHWEREQCGKYIGYLPQNIEMFPGTVEQNIARMGEVDQEAVVKAAQMAQVHDMILHLPKGYQTQIGMEGSGLSGGQLQRIGIARALYNNPRLVVFDEPNSNLDDEGLHALYATLRTLGEAQHTVFLVSHLKPLILQTDMLLALFDGKMKFFVPTKEYVQAQQQSKSKSGEKQ